MPPNHRTASSRRSNSNLPMPAANVFQKEKLRTGDLHVRAVNERLRCDDVREAHRVSPACARLPGPVVQFSTTGSFPARCNPEECNVARDRRRNASVRRWALEFRGTVSDMVHAPTRSFSYVTPPARSSAAMTNFRRGRRPASETLR